MRKEARARRESAGASHDTERCAWWIEPCDVRVECQDLCNYHYGRAGREDTLAAPFRTHGSRKVHVLSDVDDDARTATCALCGPGIRFKWAESGRGPKRVCHGVGRASGRRRRTGWTDEEYDLAVVAQANRCAVCGHSPVGRGRHGLLQADHDHARASARALLCGQCNHMLGLADDDPRVLRDAAAYLRAFG